MDRVVSIKTKARPIKKLFLLETNDINRFLKIVSDLSMEIAGLNNIFLLNTEALKSDNTLTFVERYDPDVIINWSCLDNKLLYQLFRTCVVNPTDSKIEIDKYRTLLSIFNNLPDYTRYLQINELRGEVLTNFKSGTSPEDIFRILHCGVVKKDITNELKMSIFKNIKFRGIQTIEEVFQTVTDKDKCFLYLSIGLSHSTGYGSSVWEINYNKENYFLKKNALIIGSAKDLSSIIYFWNIRATYPHTKSIWLPIELINEYSEFISDLDYIVIFGDETSEKLAAITRKRTKIDGTRYYFHSYKDDWKSFEAFQQVPITNSQLIFSHPNDKLFSNIGLNLGFMLELQGLEETFFPKNLRIGQLFTKPRDLNLFPEYFARVGYNGLSLYCSYFEPFDTLGLVQRIQIPDYETLFKEYFLDFNLHIRNSEKTMLVTRIIDLLGGYDGLSIISNEDVFELLVKLTPKRIARLIKEITRDIGSYIKEEKISDLIENNIQAIQTFTSDIIVDVPQMISLVSPKKENREIFLEGIQELYNKRILLRGKGFPCPSCKSKLWFPLEEIKEENVCYCCKAKIHIPVVSKTNILGDHYRLNELMVRGVDQGQLPVILTANFFANQKYFSKYLLFNLEVLDPDTKKVSSDIDLVIKLGKKIGLAEVKADRGFVKNRIDNLIDIANKIDADFLTFATLKKSDSSEVENLIKILKSHDLKVPAFILSKEALFSKTIVDISRYFEIIIGRNMFPSGPILVEQTKGSIIDLTNE